MRTNLSDSFATRPPVAPVAGRAKIVERNTFRYATVDGRTVTRLHLTDIVESMPGGRFRLDSGGFRTMTTKARINGALSGSGFSVYSLSGVWHVGSREPGVDRVPFVDGMIIPDAFSGSARKKAVRAGKREADLKADIVRFIGRTMKADKPLPLPDSGDCFFCAMFDREPEPTREPSGHICREARTRDDSHIREHVREGYLPGSLIVNACRDAGWTDFAIRLFAYGDSRSMDVPRVRRTVRRYIQKRLGLPF